MLFTFLFLIILPVANIMSVYGVQETNAIDLHEVTEYGDFLVSIKDALGGIF